MTAVMLPMTVKSPLNAQAQATVPAGLSRVARIPRGKAMPRKNVSGKRKRTAQKDRRNVPNVNRYSKLA